MTHSLLIRAALPEEAESLARFGRRTFDETFIEDFAMGYAEADLQELYARAYVPEAFARRISDPEQLVLVAESAGTMIGMATAGPCALPHPDVRPQHGELKQLYVARSAQGLGVGGKLLDATLGWLEGDGPRPLWIGVWSGNLRAQAVYAARGFEKAGEYEFPVGSARDREFVLRRG